jgi:hypothetical protein
VATQPGGRDVRAPSEAAFAVKFDSPPKEAYLSKLLEV